MEITDRLKKRFCKDYNLSIQLFSEPIFTDRVALMKKLHKYDMFKKTLEDFDNEDDFFYYNNELRDKIIDHIKNSEAYQSLNSCDMNQYLSTEKYNGMSSRDVYKSNSIGHYFISIDMCKANFTALVHYGKHNNCPFFDSYDYEKFMKQFTDKEYFIGSKYIRQVVFGNCNPKRQISYEKYLITRWLEGLEEVLKKDFDNYELPICSVMSDEIIINADTVPFNIYDKIVKYANTAEFPLGVEYFKVLKARGTGAYIKKIYHLPYGRTEYEVKCAQPYEAPSVYRALYCEGDIRSDDQRFDFDGHEAIFTEPLVVSIEGDD